MNIILLSFVAQLLFQQEVDKLEEAFKKEEFRSMFAEYMDEITDPKNRAVRALAHNMIYIYMYFMR
jgi:hypothetical protein